MKKTKKEKHITGPFPPVVYGLKGIMDIFKVSKGTAYRYRHSIIADACAQQGNIIMIDTCKALRLFGVENPEKFIVF